MSASLLSVVEYNGVRMNNTRQYCGVTMGVGFNELAGGPQSGKTDNAINIAREFVSKGGFAMYSDFDHGLSKPIDEVMQNALDWPEAMDAAISFARVVRETSNDPILYVIDTLNAATGNLRDLQRYWVRVSQLKIHVLVLTHKSGRFEVKGINWVARNNTEDL